MEYSEKHLHIMKTAEILFAEKGFNGTSVRDIAEKAEVNLAMINYYFGSKEKLLETIFEYRGETIKIKLESILSNDNLSSLEKMYQLTDEYINKVFNQQCFQRIMAREQVLDNASPLVREMILSMKKRNLDLIEKVVAEGQKRGEFVKPIDTPLMMSTLMGTIHNIITTRYYYRALSGMMDKPDEAYHEYIRKKLTKHLRFILKAILCHEC